MEIHNRVGRFWLGLAMLLAFAPGVACRGGKGTATAESSMNVMERARDDETNAASVVLQQYCDLESKQEYAKLYSLLSGRRKKYLEKFKVHNAEDYRKLRESSEASWSGFVIEVHAKQVNGSIIFEGRAHVEESGQVEEQHFKAVLALEKGLWRLDDWVY